MKKKSLFNIFAPENNPFAEIAGRTIYYILDKKK
jgi:hypothetical protein